MYKKHINMNTYQLYVNNVHVNKKWLLYFYTIIKPKGTNT